MFASANYSTLHKNTNTRSAAGVCVFCGGPERTRTAYLLIANEAFYQVNYGPEVSKNDERLQSFALSERGSVSAFSIRARAKTLPRKSEID